MEQPLLLQARQFLLSAALGAALGLHYDLLRGLRRWARWLTHPLDLWFALSVPNFLKLRGSVKRTVYKRKPVFSVDAF